MAEKSIWKRWETRTAVIASFLLIITALLDLPEKTNNIITRWVSTQKKQELREQKNDDQQLPQQQGPRKQPANMPQTKAVQQPQPPVLPDQYVNTAVVNRKETKEAAILILEEEEDSLSQMEGVLAALLAKRGVEPVQSLFKPAFVREGHFRELFTGDWTYAKQLQLAARVDYILLGLERVAYSSNPQFDGLLTANLGLELKCLDVISQRVCGTKTINVQGAGFTKTAALEIAVENIKPQLDSYIRENF